MSVSRRGRFWGLTGLGSLSLCSALTAVLRGPVSRLGSVRATTWSVGATRAFSVAWTAKPPPAPDALDVIPGEVWVVSATLNGKPFNVWAFTSGTDADAFLLSLEDRARAAEEKGQRFGLLAWMSSVRVVHEGLEPVRD